MDNIVHGFLIALQPVNLWYCFVGVFLGTAVGVLPGLGALTAIAVLLPLSFYLDPTTAIIMLAGVYYGGEYGSSTSSILLNIPGGPASAVTCLDGYPLARKGKAGVALLVTTVASFIGGSLGIIMLMVATPSLAAFALLFGPVEYTGMLFFGLLAASSVAKDSPMKGLLMVLLGLLLGCVGTDMQSGLDRYTFDLFALRDGLNIGIVALGIFGVAEIISSALQPISGEVKSVSLRSMIPDREERKLMVMPTLRGSGIGLLMGLLPGTGPTLASYISYAFEVRLSRKPEHFGHGAIEGIASPEASNNAAGQAGFVSLLGLGIPGTATMAVMLGALMIHNIVPGPRLIVEQPGLFWGVVASFWVGNLLLLILNIPLIGLWVSILRVPYRYLYPFLLAIMGIGALVVNNNPFDIIIMLVFGIFGYLASSYKFHPAPLLIGFLLGPLLEQNLRRALIVADGNYTEFLRNPISGTFIALSALIIAYSIYTSLKQRKVSRLSAVANEDS